MSTDIEALEKRLLALKPAKLPASTRAQILCELETLPHDSHPQVIHPFWTSIRALAASLLVFLAGYVFLSGPCTATNGRNSPLGRHENGSFNRTAGDKNPDLMLFASLNQAMHNNVIGFINFPLFTTNNTAPLL